MRDMAILVLLLLSLLAILLVGLAALLESRGGFRLWMLVPLPAVCVLVAVVIAQSQPSTYDTTGAIYLVGIVAAVAVICVEFLGLVVSWALKSSKARRTKSGDQ